MSSHAPTDPDSDVVPILTEEELQKKGTPSNYLLLTFLYWIGTLKVLRRVHLSTRGILFSDPAPSSMFLDLCLSTSLLSAIYSHFCNKWAFYI